MAHADLCGWGIREQANRNLAAKFWLKLISAMRLFSVGFLQRSIAYLIVPDPSPVTEQSP